MSEKNGIHAKVKGNSPEVEFLKAEFLRLFGNGRPLGKLFATEENYYWYDTGTNKLFSFDSLTHSLLNYLLNFNAIDSGIDKFIEENGNAAFLNVGGDILSAVNTEKILLLKKVSNFHLSPHFQENYLDCYQSKVETLMLEITESCNLRCNYCVYGEHNVTKRSHTKNSMDLETAFKAIDFYERCSGESGKMPSLYFYGGEPILKFQQLAQCVEYSKEKFQKDLKFGLTTNGTLITYEIAEYLSRNNFWVIVSIDGPEDIHDVHRKTADGTGSFKKSMEGLQNLFKAYGIRAAEYVRLNMVYSPPFSGEKLERINLFINDPSIFPKDIKSKISYVRDLPLDHYKTLEGKVNPKDQATQPSIGQWGFEKFKDLSDGTNFLGKETRILLAAQFMQRPIFNTPIDEVFLNGTCMPGIRRLYVNTKGEFHICEKLTNKLPSIGNLEEGFNRKIIKEFYIEEYAKKSVPYCSNCWASRFCTLCYAHVFNVEGNYDMKIKEFNCKSCRMERENFLKNFCRIREKDSNRLESLKDYEIN